MQFLSAADAISPALNRTRDILFRPFRWGAFLKLCAVAVLTEGLSTNFNSFSGRHGGGGHAATVNPAFHISPGTIAALVAIGIVSLILGFALLYVIVRLRFALFHCLVHRTTELTPGWRLYREQSMRFFVMTLVVIAGIIAVAAVAFAPFLPGFIRIFRESQQAGHLDLAEFLPLILQLIPVLMLFGLACVFVDVVMRDFMLPHMALENATPGEAFSAVMTRVVHQKGAFLLYALLRLVLPIAAMMGIFLVLAIPMIILFGIPGVMMAGLAAVLVHATGAAWLLAMLVEIALGLFIFALGLLIAICFGGPLSIAVRNYALLFYGGRYQVLGDQLSPPPPTLPAAPPLPA